MAPRPVTQLERAGGAHTSYLSTTEPGSRNSSWRELGVLTRGGAERAWQAGYGLPAALRAEGARQAPPSCGCGRAQAVSTGVVVQVEGAGGPRCRHTEPAWGGDQQGGPGRDPRSKAELTQVQAQKWWVECLRGLWETHLHHRAQRPGSDSLARSSGLGGRAGSRPDSGSVGLGYSSPEGKGTGWRTWCLRSKDQRRELSLLEPSRVQGWGRM